MSSDALHSTPALAATTRSCVIAGGPGTGKTRTVARLLAAMIGQPGPPPRVALAAPTGKAAARLNESIAGAVSKLELGGLGNGEAVDVATGAPDMQGDEAGVIARGNYGAVPGVEG